MSDICVTREFLEHAHRAGVSGSISDVVDHGQVVSAGRT